MKYFMPFVVVFSLFFTHLCADDFDSFEEEFQAASVVRNDPFEGYNRAMTSFNDALYVHAFIPVAKGYKHVVPEPVRQGIGNVFYNLLFPVRFVNALLQGEATKSADELFRFVINTTVGVGGIFEVAGTHFGIATHKEDFGQTLGVYGFGSGPHIVWPILGPSNLRDTFGMVGDWALSPTTYVDTTTESLALKGLDRLDRVSKTYPQYEALRKDALDLYPLMRDYYEHFRQLQIQE